MFLSAVGNRNNIQGFVGVVVVLFVFLLPFHIHSIGAPKLNKECSCLQGSRTQLAPAADIASCTPILEIAFWIVPGVWPTADDSPTLQDVRAPPHSLSV
jgi:hypothetical protein